MKKYFLLALSFLISFSFTSCLKDKNVDNQLYGTKGLEDVRLIEFPEAPSIVTSLASSDIDTTFTLVNVHLNSAEPASQDITVTLVLDPVVLDTFNVRNGTDYVIPPSSAYTLDNLTVTIPKGTRDGYVKITTKPSALTSAAYAFPFSIASISNSSLVQSANYKTIVSIVGVKNKYDGHYTVTGTMVDATNAALTGYYPLEWDLVTNGSNQVVVYDRDFTGTPTHIISTPAGLSQYGSFGLIVNFDPATNKVTSVLNYYGQPAANGRSAELDPSGENSYDPVTGIIKIKYWLNQPGANHRTSFTETWEYVGPR